MKKRILFFMIIASTNIFCMDNQSSISMSEDPGFLYEQAKIILGNMANICEVFTVCCLPLPVEWKNKFYLRTLKMTLPDIANFVSRFYFRIESEPYTTFLGLVYVMEDEIRVGKKIIDNIAKTGKLYSEENKILLKSALLELSVSTTSVLTNILYKYAWAYYNVEKPFGYPQ